MMSKADGWAREVELKVDSRYGDFQVGYLHVGLFWAGC